MKEIDEVALYHYKLKVQREGKIRRRFGRAGGVDVAGEDSATQEIVNGFMHDMSFGDLMKEDALDMAAEEEESDGNDESSGEYESVTGDSETESEESGRNSSPNARPRVSIQDPSPLLAQQPFPSSSPSTPTLPPRTESSAPPRSPSITSPSSSESRFRKLSQSIRKSRSMTFGSTRSNSAEVPPTPPVPPLPQSVAQSRSAASITGRSKLLPPRPSPPSSSHASSSRQAPPHEAPAQKRYPTGQNLPQPTSRPKKKQAGSEGLKPPELKKIPELLPIFVEMVRCCSFCSLP